MDTLIVAPTSREQIENAILRAADVANKGARSWRVGLEKVANAWAREVCQAPCGRLEDNGGGVANSYGYRASSSAVAVVWATDVGGVKHVRIKGGRMSCSGRSVGSLLGNRAQQQKLAGQEGEFILVYDKLFHLWHSNEPALAGFSKKLKKDVQDVTSWLMLADWLKEHTRDEEAALVRMFFAPVEVVA